MSTSQPQKQFSPFADDDIYDHPEWLELIVPYQVGTAWLKPNADTTYTAIAPSIPTQTQHHEGARHVIAR